MYFKAGDRPCRLCSHNGFGRVLRAAAGSGRSKHRNVDILIPLARQRESLAGPNVPCERRTDPAEPPPPTSPKRQPQHSATAKQVSPRSLRAKDRSRAHPPSPTQQRDRAGASTGSDHLVSGATAPKPILPRASLRAKDRSRCPPEALCPKLASTPFLSLSHRLRVATSTWLPS
jgi:hypothetical protein